MRVHVAGLTFALIVGTAAMSSAGQSAQSGPARLPARSGTILTGTGLEMGGGQPWENPMFERSGCEYSAECAAWLLSGCDPALAGVDPAPSASVVDVADSGGSRWPRSLHLSAPTVPPWGLWPGVVVQLWGADCTEIAKVHTIGDDVPCEWAGGQSARCELRIPAEAAWMTLSAYATTAQLSWSLV